MVHVVAMETRHWGIGWATVAWCIALGLAIPSSLVDEIKANEIRDGKVKRAEPHIDNVEDRGGDVPYYSNPTATKRGTNLKNLSPEQQSLKEWEQEQSFYQNPDGMANIRSSLYNSGESNPFDDKTVAEYEKGFRYGTNKEKLDEALENAVLKSELYGDPSSINQYRYYGNEERRRRKRSDAMKTRFGGRLKRETDLTPEEILTILTLYENERQNNDYRPWNYDSDDSNENVDEEENWLDAPVYPHATGQHPNEYGPGYLLDDKTYEKRGRWGAYADNRKKRFMVAKKRNDPTRELRYLNGPNKNDYYTLSQLLSNQREPNVPLYHRLVL